MTGESSIPIPQASDNDEDGEQSLEAPRIDFTPPYRRVSIIPALEEKLGDTLPDANDPSTIVRTMHAAKCERETVVRLLGFVPW